MPPDTTCPHHAEHVYRLKEVESKITTIKTELKEVQKAMKNPQVMVAIIMAFGSMFAGFMAFLGVVLGPAVRAYFGV